MEASNDNYPQDWRGMAIYYKGVALPCFGDVSYYDLMCAYYD